MNFGLITRHLGMVILVVTICTVPALGIAWLYEENAEISQRCIDVFIKTLIIGGFIGISLFFIGNATDTAKARLSAADGFAIAALGWILVALFAAIPYYLAIDKRTDQEYTELALTVLQLENTDKNLWPVQEMKLAQVRKHVPGATPGPNFSFLDAVFEAMSGLTTTGSTVFGTPREQQGLGLIEDLPRSLLLWRALSNLLGGMGIIVLVLAILPALGAGAYNMYEAEVPGPTADRLGPRLHDTAAVLWGVYAALTALLFVILIALGMTWFDSICTSFSTIATGGFSNHDTSIAFYANNPDQYPYATAIEWTLALFMILSGANFFLHWRAIWGNWNCYYKNTEFKFYISVVLIVSIYIAINISQAVSIGNLTVDNAGFDSLWSAFRVSIFTVASVITSTGYTLVDYDLWPASSRCLLLILMIVGACAGSTAGGMKQIRLILAFKVIYRELLSLLKPNLVRHIRLGSETVTEKVVAGSLVYVIVYPLLIVAIGLLISVILDFSDTRTKADPLVVAITASISTLSNVGTGLGDAGPTENLSWMPGLAKIVLIFAMALGRLEIYALLILFLPRAWK